MKLCQGGQAACCRGPEFLALLRVLRVLCGANALDLLCSWIAIAKKRKRRHKGAFLGDGGADGTRTRDPRRDRPVF